MADLRDDTEWLRSRDNTYKVYADGHLPKFVVCAPGGSVIGCRYTRWGARRLIRSHRRNPPLSFWQQPIVHTEEPDHG